MLLIEHKKSFGMVAGDTTAENPLLVMFRPGLAWKPGLWPGFSWLWLCDIMGQAIGHGFGLFMAWLGLGHGFLTNRCSMLMCAWTTCA